jgi:hypothetical protein
MKPNELDTDHSSLMQSGFCCLERGENAEAAGYFTDALEIRASGNVYAALAFCASRRHDQSLELSLLKEAHKLFLDELDIDGIHYCENAIKEIEDRQRKHNEIVRSLLSMGTEALKVLLK